MSLTTAEHLEATYGGLVLLSRVLLEGVSAELHPYVSQLDELDGTDRPLDELAALHQATFRFNLLPYESVFLDEEGLLGGPRSQALRQLYQTNGFDFAGEPDHIGNELGYLAFLIGAESHAVQDRRFDIASTVQVRQRAFLREHLMLWLPAIVVALDRQSSALYRSIGDLVWQIVLGECERIKLFDTGVAQLAASPDLASDPDTSLKQIALFLTQPSNCGAWQGQEAQAKLGRMHDLPRGFGGRVQTFMSLFRSASQFDAGGPLFQALASELGEWQAAYEQLAVPANAYVGRWLTQVTAARAMFDAFAEQAAKGVVVEDSAEND